MSNWLISGGCGFIGKNLIPRLLAAGESVRVFDNCSVCGTDDLACVCKFEEIDEGAEAPKKGLVQFVRGDIRKPESLRHACSDMDIFVHLAANTGVPKSVANPELDFDVNARGTFNALEAAHIAGVKRFIFASSGAPAGNAKPPVTEETVPHPISPYGASKLAGEGYCSAWHHCFGLETVALRFSNVYGPWSGHKTSVIAKFLNAALSGKDWEIYGDGSQTRDFIYVGDLVEAILRAAWAPGIGGEIFQISTGQETSLAELAALLASALKKAGLSAPAGRMGEPRLGDMPKNYALPAKAAQTLGWRARTDLKEGISKTVKWYLSVIRSFNNGK